MPSIPLYNPDILSCLANLSSDEIFTPPQLVNKILDLLPNELWRNKDAKFFDPATKSGVFLREIAKRLMIGLEKSIPNKQERINNIFKNQLFGIAITDITALLSRRSVYCSKNANGKYSVCEDFEDKQGNIKFKRIEHYWEDDSCIFCGAKKDLYDRDESMETHAYQFIHTNKPEVIFNMKFDVIIGNPPYQLSDGSGKGAGAIPIYHLFVQQAKKLNPRYLTMIIPSRWFAGGRNLDDFRDNMLNDDRIRIIHDFVNSSDCFPGVSIEGGVCYFLWDRDNIGDCRVITHDGENILSEMERPLLEQGFKTFIRYNEAIPILHKVMNFKEKSFSDLVSSEKPFGLRTFFQGQDTNFRNSVKIYANKKIGYVKRSDVIQNQEMIDKYKVFISMAYGMGNCKPFQVINKPILGEPNSCCTETYLAIGPFKTKNVTSNVIEYIKTKFFRFLILLKKNTQHAAKGVYVFVPQQNFDEVWTDKKLYSKYNLSIKEIGFIEEIVRSMGENND